MEDAGALGALVAAGAIAVAGGRQVARSRLVREKRASLATSRALAALKAGHADQARAELFSGSVLELHPEDAPARRRLAALELAQGNTELAFLEYSGPDGDEPGGFRRDGLAWPA